MTSLTPCRRCHRRETCEIKVATIKSIRGLGLTRATLKCAIPKQDFPPGATVYVKAFEIDAEYENKHNIVRRAIVKSWQGNKACVILEPGQEIDKIDETKIGYLKVESDRMTRVDVPLVELCQCGLSQARCEENQYPPVRNGEWSCWQDARDRDEMRRSEYAF